MFKLVYCNGKTGLIEEWFDTIYETREEAEYWVQYWRERNDHCDGFISIRKI